MSLTKVVLKNQCHRISALGTGLEEQCLKQSDGGKAFEPKAGLKEQIFIYSCVLAPKNDLQLIQF